MDWRGTITGTQTGVMGTVQFRIGEPHIRVVCRCGNTFLWTLTSVSEIACVQCRQEFTMEEQT